MFQSTFPRGERQRSAPWSAHSVVFQSTFPRGERLGASMIAPFLYHVSIHVPARGTTAIFLNHRSSFVFQSTFPRGERLQLPIIFIYSPCSFLCNYTNRFFSIQVLPSITTLFSLILYKYSGANLPGNTCLLAVRTHTLPHWPVRLFLINMFPVNALYKVHLDPSHSECRISSDMQSLCRIQPWHPAEIHFPIYTI